MNAHHMPSFRQCVIHEKPFYVQEKYIDIYFLPICCLRYLVYRTILKLHQLTCARHHTSKRHIKPQH